MDVKARILQQAEVLFLRNGIKGVSMDDIAAALSMSKKTLYKAFANKDEIVQAAMTSHLHKVQGDCVRIGERAANAVQKMVLLSRWADSQFSEVHPSIIHDLRKFHPVTWALFREHQYTFILAQIIHNLRRGIAEGVFRANLDVGVLARLHLGQAELVFDPELYPPEQFTTTRIHQTLDEHFLLGIATPHGQQLFAEYRHQPEMAR
ncbi:TetR/AcrR family transcriptional regulator (plasmid) [Hymenobacter monticola]|uniref:TetR/AcrR family transcriptional regulator n=1 Tax=Hymenobacter monticola TaxID=1705399 RepID=A0ABY4BBG6_9BACT|nr:TetR/AcrR family transcriptional regulator [Hymenobacter monticola]UOE36517.1 TetR/AcrR family transcriptional regulator [Hymenobacter monticola]